MCYGAIYFGKESTVQCLVKTRDFIRSLLLHEGKHHTFVRFTILALDKIDDDDVGHMLNFVCLLIT